MLIPFVKMQAQGNDFVILNAFEHALPKLDYAELAAQMCQRRFAIGADGLVLLMPAEDADAQMIIYNSDGSRAEMCGSALRCVSRLSADHYHKTSLTIATDSGIKSARVLPGSEGIEVNLGRAKLIHSEFQVGDFVGDLLDIGNPHYVLWREDLSDNPHLAHGAYLEHHSAFSVPVNVHFAQVLSPDEIAMKIWEHACGATLACGTGAASTVYSGIKRGLLQSEVKVRVPGGILGIRHQKDSDELLLWGTVIRAFEGTWKA
ncbi:MAG: diaminopimelate epimerase [Candidatus Cloacimonetes bacterium]|nr:diaminopimelate epimerase [Candidatus Cloacimonadota bacterium]